MDLIDLLGEQRQEPGIQDAPFSALVESYQRYYAAGSSHTARAKRLDLRHFSDFLARYRGLSKPEKLRVRDWDHSSVQRFVDDRLQIGEAPATVARRLATLKHMGRTLSEKLPGFVNPAREVKPPKIRPPRPKGLSEPDLAAARERADARMDGKRSFIRIRNYTLFEFLLDTGIRADEARLLKRGQLDEKMEWVQNVRTKGKRYRNVYITSRVRPLMQQYLEARAYELKRFFARISKSKDAALPLFLSTYAADPAKPESFLMGAKTIWRAVHEFSHERQLHPHLLRHSFAIDLLEHSNDVRLVAQALGHSDVRVTMRYTERTDEEVKRALEASRKASRQ